MIIAAESNKKRSILALLSLITCTSIIFLDYTIVPVSLPTIERELDSTAIQMQWIINIYVLAIAIFVIAGGRVADLIGHRKMFCWGLAEFALASILGGFAPNSGWLIISRFLQGLGAAVTGPSSIALLIEIFPASKRGKMVGLLTASSSLFLSLGPFLGGTLIEYFSWRYVFWVNVPLAALGIILALIAIPKRKTYHETFDFRGFVCVLLSLGGFSLGVIQARDWGWGSPIVILLFILSVIFFYLMMITREYAKHPFIDFALFRNKGYLGGNLVIFFAQFILMITIFWPLFFQRVLGLTPVESGVITAITTSPILILAPLVGYISDKIGPRVPVAIGFFLIILCFMWLGVFHHYESIGWLYLPLFFFGSGIALVMTPTGAYIFNKIPNEKRGIATSVYYMVRNTAGTIALSIFGSMMIQIKGTHFDQLLSENPATADLNPRIYWGVLVNLQPSLQALSELSIQNASYVKAALITASTTAFTSINILLGLIAVIALICSLIYLKSYRSN